ncbi:MAG: porin [Balneolaceae bacterium]
MKPVTGLLCLLFFITPRLSAQVAVGENGTISGLAYSDYYYIASHHNESLEKNNGFWFRRIYLTYDQKHSNAFSSRLRFEMNSAGDFLSGGSMTPFVKDAYLKWENDQHALYAGISSVPTFGLVESTWSYRSVEKTPLDLHRIASSRDFGLAAKGSLDQDGRWNYHAMFGNGNGTGPEMGEGKKIMLSVSYQLTDEWTIEAYADRHSRENSRSYILQGFAGYKTDTFTFGALYADQLWDDAVPGGQSTRLRVASAFAHAALSESTTGLLRIDHTFDPNPQGENIDYLPVHNETGATLIIAGIDVDLDHNIHLIPNLEAVVYGETPQGTVPSTDIIPRLTLSYSF